MRTAVPIIPLEKNYTILKRLERGAWTKTEVERLVLRLRPYGSVFQDPERPHVLVLLLEYSPEEIKSAFAGDVGDFSHKVVRDYQKSRPTLTAYEAIFLFFYKLGVDDEERYA